MSQGKALYGERWGIEVFFGALKSWGFNFWDAHLTKLERVAPLIFILALAFIWAFKSSERLLGQGHLIPI